MKYCIWSLMGHCHYKLNDMPKAMEYYHQIETLDDPPHDMHLQRKYLEAEMALSEALRLDSSCPIVWAYLALINLQHEREWEYEQCFQQAIDFNLSNCLRNRIIHIRDVRIILDSWHEEMP
ncbi:uncharacterized protein [Anabrus simplex]|uniref:uncharacterized protein isoform X4 n=1 Tax=Anabrus simplex TaxID=316456 RepID=UPI0035A38A07